MYLCGKIAAINATLILNTVFRTSQKLIQTEVRGKPLIGCFTKRTSNKNRNLKGTLWFKLR